MAADKEDDGTKALSGRVEELEQKLAMAEQAVNDKEEELKFVRSALEHSTEDARIDVRRAAEDARSPGESKIAELQDQVTDLEGYLAECKETLTQSGDGTTTRY